MLPLIRLSFMTVGDLRAHLDEHAAKGAVILPLTEIPAALGEHRELDVEILAGELDMRAPAELLQLLPGVGLVIHYRSVRELSAAVGIVAPPPAPMPPLVAVAELSMPEGSTATAEADAQAVAPAAPTIDITPQGALAAALASAPPAPVEEPLELELPPADEGSGAAARTGGTSPVGWSVEKLQADWDGLTVAEKVRVARYGKRPSRLFIIKGIDKTLHIHVLKNPGVSSSEVAMMAGMASLDPSALRMIATNPEWVRNSSVARNLLCNAKTTLPQAIPLLRSLPDDELGRLARTGKVRGGIKDAILKKLGKGPGKGK